MRKTTPEALKGELAALSLSLYWILEPKRRSKVLWRIHAVTEELKKTGSGTLRAETTAGKVSD